MRASWMRTAVVAVFTTLYMASGIVSAFGVCCQHGDPTDGPTMECCLKGGANHICPFMSKRAKTKHGGGAVKGPCAAGHDSGVPSAGFGAPPLDSVDAPRPAMTSTSAVSIAPQALTRAHHPPSPPPKA